MAEGSSSDADVDTSRSEVEYSSHEKGLATEILPKIFAILDDTSLEKCMGVSVRWCAFSAYEWRRRCVDQKKDLESKLKQLEELKTLSDSEEEEEAPPPPPCPAPPPQPPPKLGITTTGSSAGAPLSLADLIVSRAGGLKKTEGPGRGEGKEGGGLEMSLLEEIQKGKTLRPVSKRDSFRRRPSCTGEVFRGFDFSNLRKQLKSRSTMKDLEQRNILKNSSSSSCIVKAQLDLKRTQSKDSLAVKIRQRPSRDELLQKRILTGAKNVAVGKSGTKPRMKKGPSRTGLTAKKQVKKSNSNEKKPIVDVAPPPPPSKPKNLFRKGKD